MVVAYISTVITRSAHIRIPRNTDIVSQQVSIGLFRCHPIDSDIDIDVDRRLAEELYILQGYIPNWRRRRWGGIHCTLEGMWWRCEDKVLLIPVYRKLQEQLFLLQWNLRTKASE